MGQRLEAYRKEVTDGVCRDVAMWGGGSNQQSVRLPVARAFGGPCADGVVWIEGRIRCRRWRNSLQLESYTHSHIAKIVMRHLPVVVTFAAEKLLF